MALRIRISDTVCRARVRAVVVTGAGGRFLCTGTDLEGFHIAYVHAGLNDKLDYGSYRTELFAGSSVQVGISSGGEDALIPPSEWWLASEFLRASSSSLCRTGLVR